MRPPPRYQIPIGSRYLIPIGAWYLIPILLAGCEQVTSLVGGGKKSTTSAAATAAEPVTPTKSVVPPSEVLATVNGAPISKADIELRLQEFKALTENLGQLWTPPTHAQLEAGLDELINNELMSQAAVKRGLDRTGDTQRRWDYARRQFFAQEWLRWNQQRLEVGSAEVEQFYEQNKLGFREPERRRLRQLAVGSEDEAKRALSRLLAGEVDVASLAQQISLAPTAAKGGLLEGWVMRANEKGFAFPTEADAEAAGVTSLDPALEATVFAINQVDALSGYVKGPDGRFHIFQLVERQEERQRPLSEVWDQVKNFLLLQKLQGEMDALRAGAAVERFTERLGEVKQP
jgi:hypothetical protein